MPGTVYLVGAGPGDPGLMTRRALDLIASADVILYDRLIPPGALDGARADAELRYEGKQPGGHSQPSHAIETRTTFLRPWAKRDAAIQPQLPEIVGHLRAPYSFVATGP